MTHALYAWLFVGLAVLAMRWQSLAGKAFPRAKERLLDEHSDPLGRSVLPAALKAAAVVVPALIVLGWPYSLYRRVRDGTWLPETLRSSEQTDTDQ
jgi:hypothetical protein